MVEEKKVVSRRWISEKMGMGDLSRVSSGVREGNLRNENEIRR